MKPCLLCCGRRGVPGLNLAQRVGWNLSVLLWQTAVCTNDTTEATHAALRHGKLDSLFDYVVCGDDKVCEPARLSPPSWCGCDFLVVAECLLLESRCGCCLVVLCLLRSVLCTPADCRASG